MGFMNSVMIIYFKNKQYIKKANHRLKPLFFFFFIGRLKCISLFLHIIQFTINQLVYNRACLVKKNGLVKN